MPTVPPPALIDTHAHLTDGRLAGDIDVILARARAAGVVQVVAPATTAADAAQAVDLAAAHPGVVHAAVAIHPNDVAEAGPDDFARIVALAGRPGVVAIGETGLDRYWKRTPFDQQQEALDRHLDLAAERALPIILHCREAYEDLIAQLGRRGAPIRGILHSFTGTADDARALLDLGLHISFAGMVTFTARSADPLRAAAAGVPLDRLLVETDSPYLSPHPFRGKTNEPARVALVASALAPLLRLSLDDLAAATTANARRLFGLPEPPTAG